MNKGTQLRTILAIATSINTALIATDVTDFNSPTVNLIYKVLSVVLNFIIVALVRAAKAKDSYEDVYDEDLDVDEDEGEEEEE